MKHLLILLISIALTAGCKKHDNGIVNSTGCPVSPAITAAYTESAQYIMMQEYMNDTTLPGYRNANLSATEQAEILGYIQAVYDLTTPERDSVFNVHNIKAFPVVSLKFMNLKVNTAAPEIQAWIAGSPTGNSSFDAFIAQYNLGRPQPFYSYPIFNWLSDSTTTPHNMIEIARQISAFPFIYIAEPDGYAGDGNRISIQRGSGYADLDFSAGWGDCPSGCIYRRHWVFRITNCSATFLRSY
jgi:hypothetical protein